MPWWAKPEDEQIAKDAPRTSRYRPFLSIGALVLVVGTMVGAIAASPDPNTPRESEFGAIEYPANALATLGQCGGVFDFEVPERFSGEIPVDFFDNPNGPGGVERTIPIQPMIVPAYGYFYNQRESPVKEFWEIEDEDELPKSFEYLAYMWHGWSIIWYDDEADSDVVESVRNYVAEHDKVMAMPWMSDNGRNLPLGRNIGFSAWGVTRSCGLWDDRLADDFIEFAQNANANRDPSATYPATLDDEGELIRIRIPQWKGQQD